MRKFILATIYSLVAGIAISTLGAVGRFSVKADALANYSPTLFQGSLVAVIVGIVLIFVAVILFFIALSKSVK